MKLYSYVVARDFGFAPNPFFGVCTLATCKPLIRRGAKVGDWVVGTGSRKYGLSDRLVFALRVAATMTYDEYWARPDFHQKRPNLRGSLKQAFGDNIYHRHPDTAEWLQENSHHSFPDGSPNSDNIDHDTQTNRVLIATEFRYWGASGPRIPVRFQDIRALRGHKSNFSCEFVTSFVKWLESLPGKGFLGEPAEF